MHIRQKAVHVAGVPRQRCGNLGLGLEGLFRVEMGENGGRGNCGQDVIYEKRTLKSLLFIAGPFL